MTPDGFRNIALGFPDAVEASHMRHPDFRVGSKIFATLGSPNAAFGMVKVTPEQQGVLLSAEPPAFQPAAGAWGRRGCTLVRLDAVDEITLRSALTAAWKATAPNYWSPSKLAAAPAQTSADEVRLNHRAGGSRTPPDLVVPAKAGTQRHPRCGVRLPSFAGICKKRRIVRGNVHRWSALDPGSSPG